MRKKWIYNTAAVLLSIALAGCGSGAARSGDSGSTSQSGAASEAGGSNEPVELTNVSYDPTRELYAAYNAFHVVSAQRFAGKRHSQWEKRAFQLTGTNVISAAAVHLPVRQMPGKPNRDIC